MSNRGLFVVCEFAKLCAKLPQLPSSSSVVNVLLDQSKIRYRSDRSFWTVFGEHRWERSRSNELDFRYRANTVLAGVQRSF